MCAEPRTAACRDGTVCLRVMDAVTQNAAMQPGGRAGIGVSAHSVGPELCPAGPGFPRLRHCPDFSNRTSLRTGLYAVKVRAEAMQEASEAVPSGMLSVLGRPQTKFSFACLEAREHCKALGIENPVCEVANYLFPDCRVISGHLEVGVSGNGLHRPWSRAAGWSPLHPWALGCVLGAPPSRGPWEAHEGLGVQCSGHRRGRPEAGTPPPLHHPRAGAASAHGPARLNWKAWARWAAGHSGLS